MTSRSRRTWSIFGACLALVGLALLWVTREVVCLERREAAARDDAHVQESMRLALWRMDSTLAPVMAQEAARDPSDYPSAGGQAQSRPSPSGAFRTWFTIDPAGVPTPPEVAVFVPQLRPAQVMLLDVKRRDEGSQVLEMLKKSQELAAAKKEQEAAVQKEREAAAPKDRDEPPPPGDAGQPRGAPESMPGSQIRDWSSIVPMPALNARPPQSVAPRQGEGASQSFTSPQFEQSKDEYQSRARMAQSAYSNAICQTDKNFNNPAGALDAGLMAWAGPGPTALEARWLTGQAGQPELFLVRTLTNPATRQDTLQGIWCDWPKLEAWLLENTRDLFPAGRLVPAPHPSEGDQAALLATIPAEFVPGAIKRTWNDLPTPTRVILAVAWVAALGAIAAVGGVLRAAISLGERRGRFVSAVTHELRTPLTTFRMYSQMLADGMVPPEVRPEYLQTLKEESERLTRVVESVLLYSRLEEGRGGAHREVIGCRALLDRIFPALGKRAADGGMALATVMEVSPDATLELDTQAVEQVILNLVDNACKYAAAGDKRIEIGCRTAGRMLEIRCRDFGPGVPADERDAVFLPFRRGARDAAGTTPGVGLGLALARGLARALGGDLVLEAASAPGASFLVTIPLSSA